MESISRRRLLQSGFVAAATLSLGPTFWRDALAAVPPAQPGAGPYGPLLAADANGIQLPAGFTSRVIAQSNQLGPGHRLRVPDLPRRRGHVQDRRRLDPRRELRGRGQGRRRVGDPLRQQREHHRPPTASSAARARTAPAGRRRGGPGCRARRSPTATSGSAIRPGPRPRSRARRWARSSTRPRAWTRSTSSVYLSEDIDGGGLYRFTPTVYPDLSAGVLEIACGRAQAVVVEDGAEPRPAGRGNADARAGRRTRSSSARGEGMWFDSGFVYLATTTDETIHAYDTLTADDRDHLPGSPTSPGPVVLKGVDNVVGSRSGDIFVGEDSYDGDPDAMDVCIITAEPSRSPASSSSPAPGTSCRAQSETVGIAFDPSGRRMYVGSQRFDDARDRLRDHAARSGRRTRGRHAPVAPRPRPRRRRRPAPAPAPLGLDIAKKISISNAVQEGPGGRLHARQGLDRAGADHRADHAEGPPQDGHAGDAHAQARAAATRCCASSPARRWRSSCAPAASALTATVEVRITTPGAAAQTFKRSVSLRP